MATQLTQVTFPNGDYIKDTNTTYSLSADTTNNKIKLTPSSGSAQSITVPYATSAGSASSATKATQDGSGNVITSTYLPKTTYEYNKEISFGSSGKLLIGKFSCYDSNVTIEINSTTGVTYHAIAILATQNVNDSGGGTIAWKTYGDASNTVTPNLYLYYPSNSRWIEIYFSPSNWSKNIIHIQCLGLYATPTNICESVTKIPAKATTQPTNTLLSNYLPLAGGQMTGDIIIPKNDNMGIKPNTNNYGELGHSNLYFYRSYVTNYYGTTSYITNWASNNNIGTPATSSAASGRGYVNFYNTCAAGGTQTKTTLYANVNTTANTNISMPTTSGTLALASTTLSGYGITDAKIASGVITLGSNTITPLTASSTLDATKLSGTIPSGCYTDTKNTAGSTDTSSKIFLIGATSQAANPQTYSQDTAYVGTDGCLYSGGSKVLTAHQDISGKADKATTLAGYGITDAKIASGTITLGSNTITPLTSSSTLNAAKLSGTIPSSCYTDTNNAVTQTPTDSTDKYYEILFSGTNDNTERTEGVKKSSHLIFNPNRKALAINNHVHIENPSSRITSYMDIYTDTIYMQNDNGLVSINTSDGQQPSYISVGTIDPDGPIMGAALTSSDIELTSTWDGTNTSLKNAISAVNSKVDKKNTGAFFISFNNATVKNSTITNLGSHEFAAGGWLIEYFVTFSSNATGFRRIMISNTSTGDVRDRFAQMMMTAISGTETRIKVLTIQSITADATLYFNAVQNSGSNLTASAIGVKGVKLY